MFEKNFISILFGFLSGVFLASYFLNFFLNFSLLIFLLFLFGITFFLLKGEHRYLIYFCVSLLIGALFFQSKLNPPEKTRLDYFVQNNIELEYQAIIESRPIEKPDSVSMVIKILSSPQLPGEELGVRALLRTYEQLDFKYGQEIKFRAALSFPENFETDNGRYFNYVYFLEKDKIFYTSKATGVTIVRETEEGFISSLYELKDSVLDTMYRLLPKTEASLLAGVLLGEKTALGESIEENFRNTGLMHIVVLSGYNVSLVILAVMFVLSPLPRFVQAMVSLVGIVCFALLVGAGPTVVRASIMATFIVFGQLLGRSAHVERGMLLAACLMVLWNPWVLYFDISFQLSFLATYAIIVFPDILEKYFLWIPKIAMLRESFVATLSAQIMVAPLILYYIGDFSIVAPVVNALVLFMVPIVMFVGFIMVCISWILPLLNPIFVFVSLYGLRYILFVVDIFSKLPFASFQVKPFSFIYVFMWYLLVFFFVYRIKKIHH